MLVTLRNGLQYYVLIGTGMGGYSEDVLARRCGNHTGWLTMTHYTDDLEYLEHEVDPYFEKPDYFDRDELWDIVSVATVSKPSELCASSRYRTVWERK